MRRIRTDTLDRDAIAALNVYHPAQHRAILVTKGGPIQPAAAARLARLGVRYLWIDDQAASAVDATIHDDLPRFTGDLAAVVAEGFDLAARGRPVEPFVDRLAPFADEAAEIVGRLPAPAMWTYELALNVPPAAPATGDPHAALVRTVVHVAMIATILARNLGSYLVRQRPRIDPRLAADLRPVFLAGLLHDIGLAALDRPDLERWLDDDEQKFERGRAHVRTGYDMVRRSVEPAVAAAVLNHHRSYDGQGFPARIGPGGHPEPYAGESVHVLARIVHAAATFERLQSAVDIPWPASRIAALRRMTNPAERPKIDPAILAALVAVVPAFPPGSCVTLSNGDEAVVVGHNPDLPDRPRVIVTPQSGRDGGDQVFDIEAYDLALTHELDIVSVDGQEIPGTLKAPIRPFAAGSGLFAA